jgi:hypothetical protein
LYGSLPHSIEPDAPGGKRVALEFDGGFDTDAAFGRMTVDLLKEMRAEKALSPLLLAPGAELGVDSDDGVFGWPRYEDRGKENRL